MKILLSAVLLLFASVANAASIVADVNDRGMTMISATVNVEHVIGGQDGWQCMLEVYAQPKPAAPAQWIPAMVFTIPGLLPYVSDSDMGMKMCMDAAKLNSAFSNIR